MKTKITLLTAALAPLTFIAQAQEGGSPAADVQFTAEGGIRAGSGSAAPGGSGVAADTTTPPTIQRPDAHPPGAV
jgi:hypothetical protein